MASIDQQLRTSIYRFLSKDLGMVLFSETASHDVYRKQLKDHIVTIHIKIDDCYDGPEVMTFLNIDGKNIWWHIHGVHSGYTLDSIQDFDNTDFVRIIIRNSQPFKDDWRDFDDI